MRVQLDRGDKSVDLEYDLPFNIYQIPVKDIDSILFDLIKDALKSLGYTEREIFAHLLGTNKENDDGVQ